MVRSGDDDVAMFLRLIDLFVNRATNRIAAQVSSEQLAPLQLFLAPEVVTAHGIDLDRDRAQRIDLLTQLRDAADRDDRATIVTTLTAYTELLASTLVAAL